jgi:hypothetical protein
MENSVEKMENETLARAAAEYRYKMMEANKLHTTAWNFFSVLSDKATFDAILARKIEYIRAAQKIWDDALAAEREAGRITADDEIDLDPEKYAYSTAECPSVQNIFGRKT